LLALVTPEIRQAIRMANRKAGAFFILKWC
jgi:hypothetical protein